MAVFLCVRQAIPMGAGSLPEQVGIFIGKEWIGRD